jgi:NifU-like protein involved in Fe-S cluster formation
MAEDRSGATIQINITKQATTVLANICRLMTAAVKGKTRAEAEELFERFHALVTGKLDLEAAPELKERLGSLRALGGVSRFPIRVKCASLAWHALHSALAGEGAAKEVSTEREEGGPGEGA